MDEKVCELLDILVENSKFVTRKCPCKSAFQNNLFADVCDPAGYSVPSGPWNYILPCCVVPYMPSQTTEKIREMLEMIRAEMNSIIPHFKPIRQAGFCLGQQYAK